MYPQQSIHARNHYRDCLYTFIQSLYPHPKPISQPSFAWIKLQVKTQPISHWWHHIFEQGLQEIISASIYFLKHNQKKFEINEKVRKSYISIYFLFFLCLGNNLQFLIHVRHDSHTTILRMQTTYVMGIGRLFYLLGYFPLHFRLGLFSPFF